jgi:hypothetical protein
MAGRSLGGGTYNIALGYHSLSNTGSPTRCIGIGGDSVFLGGTDVIGIGQGTMMRGNSQIGGIGIGRQAGRNNAGDYNVYLGYEAGYGTGSSPYAIGNYNISLGYRSLYSITTASDTIAIGSSAGTSITTANDNIAIGSKAAFNITTGARNVIMGTEAVHDGSFVDDSVIIGYKAGYALSDDRCVFIGFEAGNQANDAQNNVLIGYKAGRDLTTGDYNVVIGSEAGNEGTNDLTTGSNNIIIGRDASASASTVSNEITLGNTDITKLRVPGINVTLKDNGGTPTQGHVLTVDANGEAGFAAAPTTTISNNTSGYFLTASGSSYIDGKSGLRAHGNAYFWSNNDNGGISFGTAGAGSFGTTPTIARAQQSGYHMSGSGSGDLCIGAEYQNDIRFGTTSSSSGGLSTRLIIQAGGDVLPGSNGSQNLGNSSTRWNNIYSADLQLSNESKKDTGGNDVDGTWGDWTLQEGENDIFMINNRTGKKFAITMREVS